MSAEELRALARRVCEEAGNKDACWIWPRAKDKYGRGRIWVDGRIKIASRAVWEAFKGPAPNGMLVCHHCDNPSCINPAHLYLGTPADNARDMKVRGRTMAARYPALASRLGKDAGAKNTWARGERNPKAKLNPDAVSAIRSDTRPTRIIADELGVSMTTIQRIRKGTLWPAAALLARAADMEARHDR